MYQFLSNVDMILLFLSQGLQGREGWKGAHASWCPGSTTAQLCDLEQASPECDSAEVPTSSLTGMLRNGHSRKKSDLKVKNMVHKPSYLQCMTFSLTLILWGTAGVGRRRIQLLNRDLKNSISRNPHLSIQGIPGKTGP